MTYASVGHFVASFIHDDILYLYDGLNTSVDRIDDYKQMMRELTKNHAILVQMNN